MIDLTKHDKKQVKNDLIANILAFLGIAVFYIFGLVNLAIRFNSGASIVSSLLIAAAMIFGWFLAARYLWANIKKNWALCQN